MTLAMCSRPTRHADYAALLLEPFVSERNLWIIRHHAMFQGYYFNHFFGDDPNQREQFRDHVWFDAYGRILRAV